MAEFFETCDADEHIQDLCNKVKNQVQDYTNKKYDTFKAVKYIGLPGIFLVKIHVGGDDYIHIDIEPPMDGGGNFTLRNLEHKTKDDDLVPRIREPEHQIIACDFGLLPPVTCDFGPLPPVTCEFGPPPPVTCEFGPPSGPDGPFYMVGGFSETRDANEEVQNLCKKVKEQVESHTNKKYETFKAVKYQSQCVAGTNYRVKVHVGEDSYLHVYFFRPLGSNGENVQLRSVVPKSKDDDLCAEPRIPQLIACDPGPLYEPDEQFPVLGGFGETSDADEEVQKLCDKVKEQVESFKNKKYETFKAVKYRKQTVHGTNYLIKVHVGDEDYLHIEFFHELECYGGVLELIGVDQKKKDDDLLEVLRYPDITVCGIGHVTGPDEQFSVLGGYSKACDASDEIQKLCDKVKKQVENFENKKYDTFKAVTYKSQTVCGTNYLVKIHGGGDDYLHIKFSVALKCYGGGVVLDGFIHKTKDDDLLHVPRLVEMLPCATFQPVPELLDIFVGEHSVVHDANDKIQEICNQIKHDVEEYSYEKYETFKVVKYQAKAESADYRVKIQVGGDDYIHLEFCRGLPDNEGVAIYGVEHKAKDDILKTVQPEGLYRSMIPGTD